MKDQFGNICRAPWGGENGVNIWHPAVRLLFAEWLDALSKHYAENGDVFIYCIMPEPQLTVFTNKDEAKAILPKDATAAFEGMGFFQHEAGYNRDAVLAFRKYLAGLYGSIAGLNADWGSRYASFDDIAPPDDHTYIKTQKSGALKYHFERFLRDSMVEFVEFCYDCIKKNDKIHPVGIGSWGDGWMPMHYALDNYKLFRKMDYIDTHTLTRYFYDLHRLYGKPIYIDECGDEYQAWEVSQAAKQGVGDDDVIQAEGTRTVWKSLMMGSHGMNPGIRTNFPRFARSVGATAGELSSGMTLLRKKYRYVTRMNDLIERTGNILLGSSIKESGVGVFMPSLSLMSIYKDTPEIDIFDESGVRGEIKSLEQELISRGYSYSAIIEDAVLDGSEDLAEYKVIIMPYALYFPERLAERLSGWVKSGGTLVCLGPCGIYDRYGRKMWSFMSGAAGAVEIEYEGYRRDGVEKVLAGSNGETVPVNGWCWKYKTGRGVRVLDRNADGGAAVFENRYGAGRVITTGFSAAKNGRLSDFLYAAIDDVISFRDACTTPMHYGRFFTVVREDKAGQCYLFVLNNDLKEPFHGSVYVKGEYAHPVDLGVDGGYEIRTARIDLGVTEIPVHLRAGEGTAIYLGKGAGPGSDQAFKAAGMIHRFAGKLQAHKANRFADFSAYNAILAKSRVLYARKDYAGVCKLLGSVLEGFDEAVFLQSLKSLESAIARSAVPLQNRVKAESILQYVRNRGRFDYLRYFVAAWDLLNAKEESAELTASRIAPQDMGADGMPCDWKMAKPISMGSPYSDLSGEFRLAHDSRYLYMRFDLKDRVVENNKQGGRIWNGDSIEIYIDALGDAAESYAFDDFHFMVSPGGKHWVYTKERDYEPSDAYVKAEVFEGGYRIYYRIAFSELGITPVPGYVKGFNLRVFDCNTKGGNWEREFMWKSSPSPFASAKGWPRLMLE